MLDLNLDLNLFDKELKEVDILHIWNVGLDTRVECHHRRHVFHYLSEMIVLGILSCTLGFQYHGEQRLQLTMVVNLKSIERGFEYNLVVSCAHLLLPIVKHKCKHLTLLVDERNVHLSNLNYGRILLKLCFRVCSVTNH